MPAVAERRETKALHPIEVCRKLCAAPSVILDCGAGKGHFSRMTLAAYPRARILACEPWHGCRDEFLKAVPGVPCRQFAISDTTGTADLNLTRNDESNSLLGFDSQSPLASHHFPQATVIVQLKTIDGWVKEEGLKPSDVSILKLDVQGAELMALRGAMEVLKHVEVIVAEVWHERCYLGSPLEADVTQFLTANGFECYALCTNPCGYWSDAVYRRKAASGVRLNIGAGSTVIDGFTPIDRKLGSEAYPLNYGDGSVEEIRCAHMLEHLDFAEAQEAFKEWYRVLKPGGRLRISVPDVRKVLGTIDKDDNWRFKLMGGQTDANDYHKSAFDDGLLAAHFDKFGFQNVQNWHSENTDTASNPCSLNLEGFKPQTATSPAAIDIKILAVMSVPRVGWNDAWMSINRALNPLRIPVETFNGVFWGQCMQRSFEKALANGVDWLLCIDYDSMITADHVDRLLGHFGENQEIDALAALQVRRGQEETPLITVAGKTGVECDGKPIKVTTAHFGLTLIRTECLKDVKKPWFKGEPDAKGEWGNDRLDDDIWFWHQWRLAGKTIYVAPDVSIGHLQLMVSQYGDDMKCQHVHVTDWRKDLWQ